MFNALLFIFLSFALHAEGPATPAATPKVFKSSEIPAKREFPVSPDVNPCTDFYKYACSKVDDSFQLREDRSRHLFAFNDSAERLLEDQKKYFANLANVEPKGKRAGMLKNYYVACMNEPSRRIEEKAFVADTLKLVNGLKTRGELLQLLAADRLAGKGTDVGVFSLNNQDDPLYSDLALDVEWMSLREKSYYEKPEVVADLQKVIAKFFSTIGADQPEMKAQMVVDLEKTIAKDSLTPTEARDIMSSRTAITKPELLAKFPNLQLAPLLERVPARTHIRDLMPKVMATLNAKLGEMSLEDLKNVYLYNLLSGEMDDAYPDFFKARFDFENKHFGGPAIRPVRAERCTQSVKSKFSRELDSILWPRIFPNFPRKKVVALSEKIRNGIVFALKKNTWLSLAAKNEAIRKIRNADLQLVSPSTDEEWNFRTEARYSPDKPLANEVLSSKLMLDKTLLEMKGKISPKRWGMGPLTVNAYYDAAHNKFVLPVGILQYPFFDANASVESNLADVGTVIGHELGHSIDDTGSRYDAKGHLRKWMTEADAAEFKKRTAGLVDQFDKIGHNGKFTLGENIGDLVGLTAALQARFGDGFKDSNREAEKEFFTNYAHLWCGVGRPKDAERRIKEDPHSAGFARVNEQLKQQPSFRQAFQCKDDDAMVLPQAKLVKIW